MTNIENFNEDLEHLRPVNMKLGLVEEQLAKARQALNETQSLLKKSENHTSSTMQHMKDHFNNAVNTVEEKVDGVFLEFIMKIILPIFIPMMLLLFLATAFWKKIKSCCLKKLTQSQANRSGFNFTTTHNSNNRDDAKILTGST